MHITEYQYLEAIITKRQEMHDLKVNFDKFYGISKKYLSQYLNPVGNLQDYRNPPRMSDAEIIALSVCQEALGIDSENWFHSKLKSDYSSHFTHLPHITRYNYRCKRLAYWTQKLNEIIARQKNEGENYFIVDSMPVPVCKNAIEKRLKACCEVFETAPDKGFSAVNRQYFIGYKLHMVISLKGVCHSMDLSKASVHDLHYLNDVKASGINNCTIIADMGYLSSEHQLDLFTTHQVKLQTPMRSNQKSFKPFPFVFKKCRKRIETLFSQMCDHMMIKRNYAKTFNGLASRMVCKMTATTILQFINYQNGRPINQIKHALAA
ncbi:MAG: IS982 family transposase [Flavobacteriales bacterium]